MEHPTLFSWTSPLPFLVNIITNQDLCVFYKTASFPNNSRQKITKNNTSTIEGTAYRWRCVHGDWILHFYQILWRRTLLSTSGIKYLVLCLFKLYLCKKRLLRSFETAALYRYGLVRDFIKANINTSYVKNIVVVGGGGGGGIGPKRPIKIGRNDPP